MSYKVIFSRFADKDLEDATQWYESQKHLLGWEFRDDVSNCIDKIMDDRVEYQTLSENLQKVKLSRFPFDIYYSKNIQQSQILILALFHFKRNPDDIKVLLNRGK
jgi:hypothetical protein